MQTRFRHRPEDFSQIFKRLALFPLRQDKQAVLAEIFREKSGIQRIHARIGENKILLSLHQRGQPLCRRAFADDDFPAE